MCHEWEGCWQEEAEGQGEPDKLRARKVADFVTVTQHYQLPSVLA